MTDGTFTTSVRIDATPEEVFPYLTDPLLMTKWMGEYAVLDAKAGGTYAVDINGVPIRGAFVEVDPPTRVVFSWGVPGNDALPPGSTTVDIVLTADGPSTLVELTHRNLPPDEVAKHNEGWSHYLPRLVVAAGGGDPGPDPWADA